MTLNDPEIISYTLSRGPELTRKTVVSIIVWPEMTQNDPKINKNDPKFILLTINSPKFPQDYPKWPKIISYTLSRAPELTRKGGRAH